jgi:hypothetical protein
MRGRALLSGRNVMQDAAARMPAEPGCAGAPRREVLEPPSSSNTPAENPPLNSLDRLA